eukprot:TRINITY_DN51476_c0_g1_i1.p1 TRINITY_DN51476_c0_g1~~TRINITY_DN51476_c0_g1_i1.p1  ORF type:complete len:196 (-),score=46.46 TRINITY_DN51476_c0_g1_i1:19-522(-)
MLRSLVGSEMCIRDRDDEIAFTRPDVESQSNKHALQMGEVGSHAFLNASRAAVQAEVVEKEWFASDDPLHHQQLLALLTTADQLWSSWSAVPLVEAGGSSGAMVLKPAQGGPDTSSMLAVHVRLLRCLNNACLLYTSDAADEEDSVDLGGRRIIKKKKTIVKNCRKI